MAIVASGSLGDRPLGRTIAAIAQRRFGGELRVAAGAQRHAIGWRDGLVVAAQGAHPADSAVKLALGAGLITSTQASEIARALAPGADDVAIVAERATLGADHAARLRRRVIANRAMRIFALTAGDFVLDDALTLAVAADVVPIDARVIVFQGVRAHYSAERLAAELAMLGEAFQLRGDVDVEPFGFRDAERDVVEALASRSIAVEALAAAAPAADPRVALAVLYALAVHGCCEIAGARRAAPSAPPPPRATPAGSTPPPQPSLPRAPARPQRIAIEGRAKGDAGAIRALVSDRLGKLNGGADHFQLLGVPENAPPDTIRTAYFDLARQLHPDRITATGLADIRADAQRLFAQINAAFAVLSNEKRRAEYLAVQRAGGEAAVRRREEEAEAQAARIVAAEEQFRTGEMALRRSQFADAIAAFTRAVELNPDECEHHALLAWATWCAAPDQAAAARPARVALEKASHISPRNPVPHLYLGKIARAVGDDETAARHFRRVLEVSPGHGEGTSELRVVEARLAQKPTPPDDQKKPGLFGRLKR